MASVIFEPVEELAKHIGHGRLTPTLEIRDGTIQRVVVKMGDVERSWTMDDVLKRRVSALQLLT